MIVFVNPAAASDARWNILKDRLVTDGLNREYVDTVFSAASLKFDSGVMSRKIGALLTRRKTPPAERKAKDASYDKRYVGPVLLAGAYAFLRENYSYLQEIDKKYGVQPSVLVSLLLVETRLGFTLGKKPALNNLANMAAADDLNLFFDDISQEKLSKNDMEWLQKKTREKSDWAYRELLALLQFSHDNSINPVEIPGSAYGAFGICQFMPTTAISYGVDGDNDGRVDLFNKPDALASMANFLKKHGWNNSLSRKRKLKVVYRYNHSTYYARTILEVSDQLEGVRATFGPE
jgi:membrane-bound lytic murein transglycosylase B